MASDGERTILIVEDDVSLRSTMTRALEREGYAVLEAGNTFEARQALTGAENVDLIIMDLVLPGMEGHEAANVLTARQPGVKVLYTSGYTSQESLRSGLRKGDEAFLRKPFEIDELLSTIRAELDG